MGLGLMSSFTGDFPCTDRSMLKKWLARLASVFEHLKHAHSEACTARPSAFEPKTTPLESEQLKEYRAWKRHRRSLKTALTEVVSGFAAMQESTSGWEVFMGRDHALAGQPEARADVPDAAERLSFVMRILQQPQPHKVSFTSTLINVIVCSICPLQVVLLLDMNRGMQC
jgi:hypothetical protein